MDQPGVSGLGKNVSGLLARLHLQRDFEDEERPLAGGTVECESTAHRIRQPLRDRQAEPGAAMAAGEAVIALNEGLEDALGDFPRHAGSAVTNRNARDAAPIRLRLHVRRQLDAAPIGVLDRVRQQVGDDLPHPLLVADHAADDPDVVVGEPQTLRARRWHHRAQAFGERFAQVERLVDAGQIERRVSETDRRERSSGAA
jgi:hypothetical protein